MHVVRFYEHGLHQFIDIQVGQEIDDVLKIVSDLVVDRDTTTDDLVQIRANFRQSTQQAIQAGFLLLDLKSQAACCRIIDVTKKMLHTNLCTEK
jgi:hypothetical protein